ncbi:MAG: beta-ketoacyl-[acyl-carrier-protein] synthase family protein [Elusimicrobia bacterium]|nr:beta-ketoacyl-[acyl-carrier-protein] synthase family protein [Candidatus Liberimonas magnetica]
MSNRVVITGLGIIAPNGVGKDNFWKSTCSGISGIKKVSRFDTHDCPTNIAGEIDDFEPKEYMEKKTANHLSRFAQFALAASNMAIEDAKINISLEDPYRIGIAIGNTIGGKEVDEKQQRVSSESGWSKIHPFSVSLISNSYAVGAVASELGIRGPNNTFSTGCSSASSAIVYGFDNIKNGTADIFLSGGTEAPLVPFVFNAFCASGVLSQNNGDRPGSASRPFDKKRNGYVLSEGCGIVILESLNHAVKRKAKIYAEIGGYGVTNDGYNLVKMEPTGRDAARAIKIALNNSNVKPTDVDYINAHGSSSQVSDKRETSAIKQVFGEYAYKIPISSVKSMVGQALGASGGIQVIATALSIYNSKISPTINYEEQDPECDLDYTPNKPRTYQTNTALINSFGLGGNNVSMVMKKYSEPKASFPWALNLF